MRSRLILAAALACFSCFASGLARAGSEGDRAPPPAKAAEGGAEDEASGWPTYGGPASGTQRSSLRQITPENIDRLETAWIYHAGDLSSGTEEADNTVLSSHPHIRQ